MTENEKALIEHVVSEKPVWDRVMKLRALILTERGLATTNPSDDDGSQEASPESEP